MRRHFGPSAITGEPDLKTLLIATACVLALSACGKKDEATPPAPTTASTTPPPAATPLAAASTDTYFSFVVDGRKIEIAADDVTTSYQDADGSFKVFAGPDRKTSITLTVPNAKQCPCVVPAGSTEPASVINQGSVSLQHYPNPGNGLNNWYLGRAGTPPASAISITDVGTVDKGYRYVTGAFATTVLKTESNGAGPENRDYAITEGRFRLKHKSGGADSF